MKIKSSLPPTIGPILLLPEPPPPPLVLVGPGVPPPTVDVPTGLGVASGSPNHDRVRNASKARMIN